MLSSLTKSDQKAGRTRAPSWQDVVETEGRAIALLHAYPIGMSSGPAAEEIEPVLRPFAQLKDVSSFYVSALVVEPGYRGLGIGSRLLDTARQRALLHGSPRLSVVVLERNEAHAPLPARGIRNANAPLCGIAPGPTLHRQVGWRVRFGAAYRDNRPGPFSERAWTARKEAQSTGSEFRPLRADFSSGMSVSRWSKRSTDIGPAYSSLIATRMLERDKDP
jgi:GNAT superfamily N-acetyltransferase